MLTSVAFWVSQVSVVDWPFSMVLGLAVSDAVGVAGGGGGGGGGGATFFLHAPSVNTMLSAKTSVIHFLWLCFTSSSLETKRARWLAREIKTAAPGRSFPLSVRSTKNRSYKNLSTL